ncbi:MAG: hypothetical protein GY710_26240 [Desulfobacteraceae bacterium]|nr:hypothetical protein [Desulfobacteraceae bacterium]
MAEKKVVALDIETIADKTIIPLLPELKAKATLKDPEKIQKDIDEKKEKRLAAMGLNPLYNLICSVAWCDKTGPGSLAITEDSPEEEKCLLEGLWDILVEYDHFVTFNGRPFDFRCIHLHGITHRIRPAVNIDKGRYNRGNHTDLRQVLSGTDAYAPGKLDFYLKKFLGTGKFEGIDGAKVQSFFDMGLIDDIVAYNEDDAQQTFDLYQVVEAAGLLE